MAATIRDIKNMTGLSLATISKYLNGGNLLPENREKIEEAIRTLHYEVNEMARGLVTSQSKTIGVVVFDISNVFTGTVLQYLGEYLREEGYAAMICDSQNDPVLEEQNVRFLLGKKVDGMIVMPVAQAPGFLEPVLRNHIPVVLMDRPLKDSRLDCVKVNNREAAYDAVKLLADYGHRRIALISADTVITGQERLEGCLQLLKDRKIRIPRSYLKVGDHSLGHGYRSMQELLKLKERPTAVFLGNFEIILGAVMALNESPYQCPEDLSLIGFDDLIISNLSKPKLVLAVQPLRKMAEEAVRLLLKRIDQNRNGTDKEDGQYEHEILVLPAKIAEGKSIARCG